MALHFNFHSVSKKKYILSVIAVIMTGLELTSEVKSNLQHKEIDAKEGEAAELNFPYPCNSTITLQKGNGKPFYNTRKPTSSETPPNYQIDSVNDTAKNECSIHLIINPTTRDDEGGFILFAYMNETWQPDHDYRIGFNVDSTSGRAWCSSSDVYIKGEWIILHCTAAVINASQDIRCYQDGSMLPPLALTPTEDRGNIKQDFLAKETGYVFCCSSATDQIDRCQCMDCAWDPVHNKPNYNVTDPCPPISTPPDKPEDGSTPSSYQTTEPQSTTSTGIPDCDAGHMEYMHIAIGFFTSILLISIIFNLIQWKQRSVLKAQKVQENVNSELDTNSKTSYV